jgi:hypothetical protein
MNINIKGKEYNLSLLEHECLDEILHAVGKFGMNRSKCLDWGTFSYTTERRAIFDKIWKILHE